MFAAVSMGGTSLMLLPTKRRIHLVVAPARKTPCVCTPWLRATLGGGLGAIHRRPTESAGPWLTLRGPPELVTCGALLPGVYA